MKRFTAGMVVGAAATLVALVVMFVGSFATVHGAPNYEDRDWTPAMNQTSYWSPWQCTKYDGHGGWIPAQYDAAIIKAGQKVRVYPDLTSTGGFQASAPDGKDISWVMKCKHPTQPTTTTTTTTSTTSTTSSTTTTTTATTVPPTSTTSAPTTTVETSTTTSSPPTTSPPETTSTTTPGTTVVSTTEPPSTTPPSSTSTVPETPSTSSPPPTPPTSAGTTPPTPPSTPSEPRLPETGSENWIALALAAVLVGSGYGIVRIARRDA